jgi:hypothetical protein
MTERTAGVLIAFASVALLTVACVATSTSTPTNTPAPVTTTVVVPATGTGGNTDRAVGTRPQLTDSARARRDSINAFRRDSLTKIVLASIAGKENMPAESVFKNIKILKGVTAGRLVNIMSRGFSPALGVSCGFCHIVGEYEKEDKEEKQTARLMYTMVNAINKDYMVKLAEPGKNPPAVNCTTCHRGMTRPFGGPPGGPRPTGD